LSEKQPLPIRYRDHALTGNWIGHRDCHIQPDWVLIYQITDDTLILERTGTHSDLFG
jgi:mRNA interferase YafQ